MAFGPVAVRELGSPAPYAGADKLGSAEPSEGIAVTPDKADWLADRLASASWISLDLDGADQ